AAGGQGRPPFSLAPTAVILSREDGEGPVWEKQQGLNQRVLRRASPAQDDSKHDERLQEDDQPPQDVQDESEPAAERAQAARAVATGWRSGRSRSNSVV